MEFMLLVSSVDFKVYLYTPVFFATATVLNLCHCCCCTKFNNTSIKHLKKSYSKLYDLKKLFNINFNILIINYYYKNNINNLMNYSTYKDSPLTKKKRMLMSMRIIPTMLL